MSKLLLLALALFAPTAPQVAPAQVERTKTAEPKWVEITRVVDGDTIHVQLEGKVEKLRLLCVDTEEKLGSGAASPTKPQTVFGEECALWAQEFFAKLGKDGAAPKIALRFPVGRENHRDPYGRLLCHVILPDGTDYNILLVKLGKSPYFSKYGYSEIAHAEFVAAQSEARAKKIGIWDPATNAPKTPGAPSAARPYDTLLPWWDMRAEAVRAFVETRAKDAGSTFEAESGASLAAAAKKASSVRVFGEIDRVFDESDGSQTVLFRASVRDEALRVRIPKEAVESHAALKLATHGEEFQQNYMWFRGTIESNGKGYRATSTSPEAWRDGRDPGA